MLNRNRTSRGQHFHHLTHIGGAAPEKNGISQSPEEVVEGALGVLSNGNDVMLPGLLDKFSVFAQRLISRGLVPGLVAKMSRT